MEIRETMVNMKKMLVATAVPLTVLTSPLGLAQDVEVTFTADIKAATCQITLSGDNVSGSTTSGYTMMMPEVPLRYIKQKTANQAQAHFKLKAEYCTADLSKISMTITPGRVSTYSPLYLASNELTGAGTAKWVGMGFKRKSTSGDSFIKLKQGTEAGDSVVWSSGEKSSGLDMTLVLRETSTDYGGGQTGSFKASATFGFTYE